MSKRLLIAIVALTVGLFIAMPFMTQSHGKARHGKVDPAFKEFISAFTSGYVSTETKVRVVLQSPSAAAAVKNTELDNDLFDFSPGIDGKIVWLDDNTVEFKPAERLKQDQLYSVTFRLGKVSEVPAELRKFEFDFQTIPQAIDVQVEGYLVKDKSDFKVLQVSGILTTADIADNAQVEKCLIASQLGNSLKISWNHESSTQHRYVVDDVVKSKERSLLSLVWMGEAIQAKENSSMEINIPSLDEFTVMNVKVDHDPEQVVTLQCSDILQAGQNLEGLISISGNDNSNNSYYGNNPTAANNNFTWSISENEIKIFPTARMAGTKTITLDQSVKNAKGKLFTDIQSFQVIFEELKPAIKVKGKGTILPSSEGLVFPFEAVNINAVDIKITKIYESNMLQFLQVNNLEGNRELARVGKVVLKKKILLSSIGSLPKNKWTKYALDLSKLVSAEPGAIYNISMNFKKAYSIYNCDGDTSSTAYDPSENASSQGSDEMDEDEKDWDYYGNYYYDEYEGDYYDYYNYRDRENPCTPSYYGNSRAVNKNILATNIGLMAKKGNDGSLLIIAADLITTKPIAGATIEAYDYQQQILSTVKTGADGIVKMEFKKKPFVILARNGEERNYLKLEDGATNSLSTFEVNGTEIQKGLKGFIYGERGVWRPGDSLFLSFILEDKLGTIPALHPVSLELVNPMGQVVQKITKTQNVEGFYDFRTKTDNYAPTGNYVAKVRVGGAAFTKNIRIETIMPNRLKLNLDFKATVLYAANGELKGDLQVDWLHGAPGRNLEAKIDMGLTPTTTEFKNYKGFIFDSPIASFTSEPQTIFTGRTDERGYTAVSATISGTKGAPGFLSANFTVRAFEEGGAFSTDRFSLPLSPYSHYVGVKIPKPGKNETYLETDTDHNVEVVSVDEQGNPVSRNVNVKVYKMNWRWWWDSYSDDVSSYVGSDYRKPIYEDNISTEGGKGSFKLRVNRPEWGRYLVYVTDPESGHSTGTILYIDWPSWAGKSPKGNEGASMLNFSTDKTEYKVGDKVKMSIPSAKEGRAFISIETGSRVLKTWWVETKNGVTDYEFEVTAEMSPNVYIYTSLIQPHAQALNDLPIRLYGVVPILVKDENTILKPKISCEEVWKPESTAMVKVSEDNGKEMVYTLAVVDDGLLDLTRFKTPDPWSSFYAKEALGVKTWDIYDMVIGASGSVLQRILSIGGDEGLDNKSASNAQRFKPMVRFVGPFKLKKGETASHKIDIPQYVGSVRVMVIAGQDAAY
ncbi:MAG: alpha-2-macroglobulin family protein, partial [Bacteroidia bacterium]